MAGAPRIMAHRAWKRKYAPNAPKVGRARKRSGKGGLIPLHLRSRLNRRIAFARKFPTSSMQVHHHVRAGKANSRSLRSFEKRMGIH
jgi:hypothetical protein